MPETINKYSIFLASPSDLTEEREAVKEVIAELNITYGIPNNIIIELLRWETNSAPAVSKIGVQDIINNDIKEYDLFIGLLWKKFGTPTNDFGSGTEEEFNIAYQKFQKNENSLQILFYFKNALPQSLDDINPNELSKVREFKSSLGDKSVLYWDYNQKEELERFLRIHIPSRIDTLRNHSSMSVSNSNKIIEKNEIEVFEEEEEEFGIIDYQEIIEDSFATSTHALKRITEATNWISDEMNKKTDEVNRLITVNKNQPISFKVQRNLYDRTAKVMNDFANRITPEIPIYIDNFEIGIDSFSKLATIYKSDFNGNYENEIKEAVVELEDLLLQIIGGISSMNMFLETVEKLPRMSKEFNNAKKNVAYKLRELINRLEVSYSIAYEVHKNLKTQ